MGNWLDGFGMAWGMFLAIPCPLRRWNEKAREKMLVCLPLIGLIVGGVWVGVYFLPLPETLHAALLAAALIIFLVQRRKKCTEPAAFTGNPTPTVILVHGALCIAISFVLSYFKLFSMPNGGSITLASMLPLMVYSNRYGAKYGVMAGVVYGFLQYIQKPEMTHWIQMLVDYPIAFGVIGLGGLVKGERNLVFSVLIGGTLRFLCHLFTGAVFFGEYAAAGQSAFMCSLLYNAPYMFADIAVCVIIAMLPPFRKAIRSALKY